MIFTIDMTFSRVKICDRCITSTGMKINVIDLWPICIKLSETISDGSEINYKMKHSSDQVPGDVLLNSGTTGVINFIT